MRTYKDWVRKAQSKDAAERNDAFDHLVRDFEGMVYSVAFSRLSDSQLAEDAAQEAFLTAYKRITQLNDVGAFPAWLKRIALTHTDRLMRRQGAPIESVDQQDHLASTAPTPEAQWEAKESRQRVRIAVGALPEAAREVTRDFYLRGESQREISERLNIPLATVKKRLQYAREQLRSMFSGFSETFDRSIYGEPQPPKQLQPVYIRQRRRIPPPQTPPPK
ncbi:MAG: sigma-70 family RNA polymerase sigma factor [Chloroflexota bacterium]|nr:sigma-70 family RNA polymerase sigma factor [Chloroflexota bacterium]MDE2909862.1 sigma-70 family RNA polymerase sigma factor [Chloroflexota bacterium]